MFAFANLPDRRVLESGLKWKTFFELNVTDPIFLLVGLARDWEKMPDEDFKLEEVLRSFTGRVWSRR